MDEQEKTFLIETLKAIRNDCRRIPKNNYSVTITRTELNNLIKEIEGLR